jgi:hypothetical protein
MNTLDEMDAEIKAQRVVAQARVLVYLGELQES